MEQAAEKAPGSKISKTKDVLTVMSMTVTVLGALGTVFVMIAANYYMGDVEVKPNRTYQDLQISVYDMKGQQSTFLTPTFQLAPGRYHLTVSCDNSPKRQAEATVELRKKTIVPIAFDEQTQSGTQPGTQPGTQAGIQPGTETGTQQAAEAHKKHRHWWQIWKSDSAEDEGSAKPGTTP